MITEHLNNCLKYIPKDKWFRHHELPSAVTRNEWVCRKLVEEGILKSKIEWVHEKEKTLDERTQFQTETIYFRQS